MGFPTSIRFVHAADFHLGSSFSNLPADKAEIRRTELFRSFLGVISLCKQDRPDFLLIAGDLFDSPLLPEAVTREVACAFASIPETCVVIAPGNHDPYYPKSVYDLQAWPKNVFVFSGAFGSIFFAEKNTRIWGGAFHNPRVLEPLIPTNFVSSEVINTDSPDVISLLVMHGEVCSGGGESHFYNPISLSKLARSGIDYAALGHVHERSTPQKVGGVVYAYSGCPEPRGFDELGVKGVYRGVVSKGNAQISFAPTNIRSYLPLSISVDSCDTNQAVLERILSALQDKGGPSFSKNAYLLTLEGAIAGDFFIDLKRIRADLLVCVFDVRLIDCTRILLDYAVLRKEKSLRGAFTDILCAEAEAARITGNEATAASCERGLSLGLKAFFGEVGLCEDQ